MEELIAAGHPPAAVWNYTLKQLTAYTALALKRKRGEQAALLSLNTLAARGKEQAVTKRLKDLTK